MVNFPVANVLMCLTQATPCIIYVTEFQWDDKKIFFKFICYLSFFYIKYPCRWLFIDRDNPYKYFPNHAIYMAHRKVNSPQHLKSEDFFLRHPIKIAWMCFFINSFIHILLIQDVKASENIKFPFSGAI